MKTIEQIRAFVLGLAPWVIGFTIVLGSTMVIPHMSYNYANSKAIIIEIGMAFIIALGLIGIPWSAFKKIASSKILWGVTAFLVVVLLTTFLSMDPALSWLSHMERGMGTFFLVVVVIGAFFSILITQITGTFRKAILYPVSVSGMIIAASVILGYSGLNISHALVLSDVSRGGGLTGNSSYAGTILMMSLFVNLYLFMTTQDSWKKWALGVFSALTVLSPIMFSYQMFKFGLHNIIGIIGDAKGATISAILGLLVSLGIYLHYSSHKTRAWMGRILAGGIIGVSILGIVLLAFPKSFVYKTFVQQTTSARFIYWGMAVDSFKDHPVIGTGPETYRYASERYFNPEILRPSYGEEIWADKPHNAYLEILSTMGILGVLAYVAMVAAVVAVLVRLGKKCENRVLVATVGGLMVAYGLNNFILFDIPGSYLIIFFIFGWLAVSEVGGVDNDRNPGSVSNFLVRGGVGILVIIAVFSVVVPEIKKLKLVLAEMYAAVDTRVGLYQKAEDASPFGSGLSFAVRADVYSQSYMNSINELSASSAKDKQLILTDIETISKHIMDNFKKYPASTQALTTLGRLASIKIAILNSPDPAALEQMAYAGSEIIRLAPRNVQGYWILGQVAIYNQDYDEALKIFNQALEIDRKVPTSHLVIINLAKLTNDQALLAKATAEFERDVDLVDRKQWLNGLVAPL